MDCSYRNGQICNFTKNNCPWVYWCGKIAAYKERDGSDKYCKYRKQEIIPSGYSKVEFEKRGYLYITIDNQTLKLPNPYDYIPKYVKLYQSKGNWKIKKEKEIKE